jgi:hypothetical protein
LEDSKNEGMFPDPGNPVLQCTKELERAKGYSIEFTVLHKEENDLQMKEVVIYTICSQFSVLPNCALFAMRVLVWNTGERE